MDVLSFSRATKVKNEVEKAREENTDLDERLDEIVLMTVLTVGTKSGLPVDGVEGKPYLVLTDSTNDNRPTLYTYKGTNYVRVDGQLVASSAQNGAITIDGTKIVVYTHPDNHSADMLVDGLIKVIMTKAERDKLGDVAPGANNYEHPPQHSADMLIDGVSKKVYTKEEKEKVATVEKDANYYEHPETHSMDEITDTLVYVRMTQEERDILSGLVNDGGEANQKAFSIIQVGDDLLQADTKTATVKYVGDNVDIQVDDVTKEVTFKVTFPDPPEIPDPVVPVNHVEELDYPGVTSYIHYNNEGKILHKVMIDNNLPQNIKPPVDVLPGTADGYVAGDSFLVKAEGEVYICDGATFHRQYPLIKVINEYTDGLLTRKLIEENYTTPVTREFIYTYDQGSLIATKVI